MQGQAVIKLSHREVDLKCSLLNLAAIRRAQRGRMTAIIASVKVEGVIIMVTSRGLKVKNSGLPPHPGRKRNACIHIDL